MAALWAYDGWNNVSMVSSEIKDPQKNLPRALIGGTLCVIAIYMLANAAYFHVMTPSEVAGSTRVAAEMMRKIFQAPGAAAVSIAAMISIFAALNGSILSGARVPYAAARDGYFFHAIGRVHPKYHTPGVSIIVLNLWACLLVLSGKYDDLFNLVIFASWILYGMTAAAFWYSAGNAPIWCVRTGPGLSCGTATFYYRSVILLFSTALERPRESAMGIGLMALGLPSTIIGKNNRAAIMGLRTRYWLADPVLLIVLISNQEIVNLYLVNPMNWRENRSVYWSQKHDSFVVSTVGCQGQGRPGGLL